MTSKPDAFGRFVVYAIYSVAAFWALWPVIGLIADPGDPGHLERFVFCPLVALGIAVIGKALSLLIELVGRGAQDSEQDDGEERSSADAPLRPSS